MSRLQTLVLLTVLLLPQSGLLHAQATPDRERAADRIFARWHSTSTPGCAVAAEVEGQPALSRAYGMADLEHGIPNRPETIFEAGSVSKQFTAAAVVLLALEGKLALDDDVRRYLPELPDYGRTVTVRHLMNHTSGLRDWGSVAAVSGWGRGERTHTHAHVLDILARQRALNYAPGAEYSYTNSGYNLMAVIVDRVSGMPFAEFSRVRIFEPLGLADTQWRDDYRRIVPGRAAAFAADGEGFTIDRPIEHVHGNGGLLTTVRDLLRWDRALASGELGGPEFVRLMHERGVLNDGTVIGYAGGLQVGERHGTTEVSHTGATAGYRAFLGRYPEQGVAVAVLCNVGAANPGALGGAVADLFLAGGGAAAAPGARAAAGRSEAAAGTPPAPLPPAALAAYAGRFHSDDAETTFTVMVEGDRLLMLRRPDARTQLVPLGADRFRAAGREIRFQRDETGRVTGLSLHEGRIHDLPFQRVD
jgi:CubicO group peptidase (beta-lactamase class C family)